ncbi:aspartate aminotransferase family protein [Paraburkholderia sp. J67]|uniref:aspartate aminotransferase family protein n=1 Tax=Paraburkholderia sp. J67 TaxID=2805435 RepID=UPI002ABDC552|nr:aspartate aminotransferase family protein [Paraburkholderia sp. J67]
MNANEKILSRSSETAELEALAKKHLLMHFTHNQYYRDANVPIMARGEGCWVYDSAGNRYLDGLAGLFCVQIGYSHGNEIGAAVQRQMSQLPYFSNWSYAHEPAIRLAAKVASLAPAGLNRVFFTSSGSESNESAIKLARQYHIARGDHAKTKFIARRVSYHGTSYGALSLNGMTNFRKTFEPLMPGVRHVSNTKRYRRPIEETEAQFTAFLLEEIESLIVQEGPDTVAGIFVEPLQNAGGSLTPPAGYAEGLRRICDRHGVLLVADEVICGFGRLGEWFGSTRYGFEPDIITFAKGIGSGHVPLGGLIATDAIVNTVLEGPQQMFLHGLTYGGHPAACAAALANLQIMEREGVLENVRNNQDYFRSRLATLLDHPLVGDLRGDGYHYSLELVTDKTKRTWSASIASSEFVSRVLSPALFRAGLLCRAAVDHEGTPLIQMSPPLILSRDEIDWMVETLKSVLEAHGDVN